MITKQGEEVSLSKRKNVLNKSNVIYIYKTYFTLTQV